jgi:hypothetical protein
MEVRQEPDHGKGSVIPTFSALAGRVDLPASLPHRAVPLKNRQRRLRILPVNRYHIFEKCLRAEEQKGSALIVYILSLGKQIETGRERWAFPIR